MNFYIITQPEGKLLSSKIFLTLKDAKEYLKDICYGDLGIGESIDNVSLTKVSVDPDVDLLDHFLKAAKGEVSEEEETGEQSSTIEEQTNWDSIYHSLMDGTEPKDFGLFVKLGKKNTMKKVLEQTKENLLSNVVSEYEWEDDDQDSDDKKQDDEDLQQRRNEINEAKSIDQLF